MSNPSRPANRLASERSPYLLQHAHNPVDWQPWGDEAFERARREDKPVFLSVGYSACHWCHVMERESFENEETARFLNEHFVSIKVDREERPDVDQVYQLAHQVLTQRGGGWPLSVWLTHDRRPFFAGTYFPPARRYGRPSFGEVLAALHDAYTNRRSDVDTQADDLVGALRRVTAVPAGAEGSMAALDPAGIDTAVAQVMRRAEKSHGGFGRAPKFPNTMTLDLLLIAGAARGNSPALEHALFTLDRMARGGIYDHLGGGFARYSTDEKWLIPHFEKMLYDNAQFAGLYLEGWRVSTDPSTRARARGVVAEVLGYVLREMTDTPTGVFYSAQDADSEGEEGRFFVWTREQIAAIVGEQDAPLVWAYFDVSVEGNFEHHRSALSTPRSLADVAKSLGRSEDDAARAVERSRALLFAAREKRVRPMRDDKCLAGWNALMISAMVDAGATLGERTWSDAASRALGTWRTRAFRDERLAHAMKNGEAYGTGFLDDYAGMCCAAIDVYEAGFDPADLAFARALCDAMLALFWDENDGAMYFSPSDGEVVVFRAREVHDHAYPGGVGLAADALLRLATLTGVLRYRAAAERLLAPLATSACENPLGMSTVVRAADRAARGAVEIVILGAPERGDTHALLAAARAVYVPHRMFVRLADEADGARHGLDRALYQGRTAGPGGEATAFVCRGTVCDAPTRDPAALQAALRQAVAAR